MRLLKVKRDRLGLLSVQAQKDVAHGPNGSPGPQGLGGGRGAVHVHRGHAPRHAQLQLVPAQVKELGHREDAGHEVAVVAPGPELQALLLAVDFQRNLWVPISIGHLKQIPRVPAGVLLQQHGQHQGKLIRETLREHASCGLGEWGRPQSQDEGPVGVADLLDGRGLHEAESADEVEAGHIGR